MERLWIPAAALCLSACCPLSRQPLYRHVKSWGSFHYKDLIELDTKTTKNEIEFIFFFFKYDIEILNLKNQSFTNFVRYIQRVITLRSVIESLGLLV